MPQLQALILAAGSSRRFPTNKLLRALPDQRCLLDISYQLASVMTPDVLLVINDDVRMREYCRSRDYRHVVNPVADTGMASSIVCALTATAEADAWAIFLADMPRIKPATLRALADNWSAHSVTVPTYQHRQGHPVIFPRSWFTTLCALTGDQGARQLLRDNPRVKQVPTEDAGVCFDIDTEADWENYLDTLQAMRRSEA
jgi:molybdenum cofactor cytidylyltransferase